MGSAKDPIGVNGFFFQYWCSAGKRAGRFCEADLELLWIICLRARFWNIQGGLIHPKYAIRNFWYAFLIKTFYFSRQRLYVVFLPLIRCFCLYKEQIRCNIKWSSLLWDFFKLWEYCANFCNKNVGKLHVALLCIVLTCITRTSMDKFFRLLFS